MPFPQDDDELDEWGNKPYSYLGQPVPQDLENFPLEAYTNAELLAELVRRKVISAGAENSLTVKELLRIARNGAALF